MAHLSTTPLYISYRLTTSHPPRGVESFSFMGKEEFDTQHLALVVFPFAFAQHVHGYAWGTGFPTLSFAIVVVHVIVYLVVAVRLCILFLCSSV